MKKVIISFFLALIGCLSVNVSAQQSASATWPLTSTATRNATVLGGITAASETIGPLFPAPTYNNRTTSGGSSVSTQNVTVNPGPAGTSSASAHNNGGYVQFAVTPQTGYEFTVNTISFNMGSGNANSNGTSVEYSFNPDFSLPVVLGGPSGAASFPSSNVLYPFSFSPSGLTVSSGQTLYLRIYAWNGNSTALRLLLLNNLVISGATATSRPTVTTTAVSNVTHSTATTGGNVVSDAGNAVTERGIVYSTSINPTTADTKIMDVSGGTGSFTTSLTGLAEYTTFHVRAYAINSAGTAYGEDRIFTTPAKPDEVVTAPKQMEKLDRGLVAVRSGSNQVYIGWRLFGTDPAGISFNVYRNGVKVNNTPITNSTNYVDNTIGNGAYTIKPVIDGVEQNATKQAPVWAQNYLDIPLQKPTGGTTPDGESYTYTANDCSVGDLDGDGEYEIVLKWDPTNAKDNSQSGYTGNVYLDAYKLNGTRLWRIDLGKNIRAGAHYTQFMVYDLDGDGRAELACKTADGTVDGKGMTIGDPIADYRNSGGYILSGQEFLTIFNGETGAAMATSNYLPGRGSVASWGDTYGNRVDRFIAAVAYLDGSRPSLIMGRGYYTRLVRAAWDWRNGQLTLRWMFDSDDGTPGNSSYREDGNHQMTIGDVDGDGKQEVFNGSSAINDNGRGLWTNNMGHGDALHMSDLDPDRPGLEMWQPYEDPSGNGGVGAALVDAKTGERIFTVAEPSADVGRGLAADIDPRYKGYEVWAARGNLYTAKGVQIGTTKPSMNFAIWWDGDLLRELLDGTTIQKWNHLTATRTTLLSPADVLSNNSTKATPGLSADILGDWREEVIFRTSDNEHLRIYTTTIPTEHRIYTLMHDPQYRVAIAWQNSAYNQPPHPGFYLGTGMDAAPIPNIEYAKDSKLMYYKDVDGDGWGREDDVIIAIEPPQGYVLVTGDCADWDASIYPGAAEVFNWKDDDCDGLIDEGPGTGPLNTYYKDVDSDGWGRNDDTKLATVAPPGYAALNGDCADWDASIHPGATEMFNWKDDDCDGLIDEGTVPTTALSIEQGIMDKDVVEKGKLTIGAYPNPSAHAFRLLLKSGNSQVVQLRVTDLLGRLVENRTGIPANTSIQLGAHYRTGTYIVEVIQGKERKTLKLVKITH